MYHNYRELDHDIIGLLNLGGVEPEAALSVLNEDFDEADDDKEYDPNEDDDDDDEGVSDLSY